MQWPYIFRKFSESVGSKHLDLWLHHAHGWIEGSCDSRYRCQKNAFATLSDAESRLSKLGDIVLPWS
jgi:hypothetical protein